MTQWPYIFFSLARFNSWLKRQVTKKPNDPMTLYDLKKFQRIVLFSLNVCDWKTLMTQWPYIFFLLFLGGVPEGYSHLNRWLFLCVWCVMCDVTKKRKLSGWVFYSPNLYWGQTGVRSVAQTAEHVYNEWTVLFSLAQTQYPTYFARLQFLFTLSNIL
jgi:hypothetical protein